MTNKHRIIERIETPPTRWQDEDEDTPDWIRSAIIFVLVFVLGGGAIWVLNMLLDKIFGKGG